MMIDDDDDDDSSPLVIALSPRNNQNLVNFNQLFFFLLFHLQLLHQLVLMGHLLLQVPDLALLRHLQIVD